MAPTYKMLRNTYEMKALTLKEMEELGEVAFH